MDMDCELLSGVTNTVTRAFSIEVLHMPRFEHEWHHECWMAQAGKFERYRQRERFAAAKDLIDHKAEKYSDAEALTASEKSRMLLQIPAVLLGMGTMFFAVSCPPELLFSSQKPPVCLHVPLL